MRTALISDIHGHLSGLENVLEDIRRRECDRILCLGDLVEGGNNDLEVIEVIQELQIPCVRGNHDQNNPLTLPNRHQQFLSDLPTELVEDDVLYCHISPRRKMLKIRGVIEAWNVFDETSHRLIFTGHQHRPLIYGEKSEIFAQATLHEFEYHQPFFLDPQDRYIICVGSVSYGRDAVGKLRYAIFDSKNQSIEHRLVDGDLLPRDYTKR